MCQVLPNAFLLQYLHFPHFWSAFYHSTDCDMDAVICGKTAVTWFAASTNQCLSALSIPHFTIRNSAFYPQPDCCHKSIQYIAKVCGTGAWHFQALYLVRRRHDQCILFCILPSCQRFLVDVCNASGAIPTCPQIGRINGKRPF